MTTQLRITTALVTLFIAVGCSKQSAVPAPQESGSQQSSGESKELASGDDKRCEEILNSPDIMEARDWITRYPKSLFSSHAIDPDNPNGTPLAPVITHLSDAGAQRVVIHYGAMGKGQVFLGLVVVLPSDTAARQKLFALDPELSQLTEQKRAVDYGQKYLYYSK
jgi:hypothetical protein